MGQVILVTGASAGIGALCAQRLAAQGHKVYAASRRGSAPEGCTPVIMDVDRDDSVNSGIETLLKAERRIDAVVHCAGWGLAGAIEDTAPAEAQAQFETLFFGAHRVCRAVLPSMRKQGGGKIVLISSLVADIPVPYQAFYSAAKAALASYAEALWLECAPFGIRVVNVEPGNFRTEFTGARRRSAAWNADSAHAKSAEASIAWMEHDERRAPPPDAVVERIVAVLGQARPALHHVVVAHTFERVGAWLRCVLPERLYLAVVLKVFRVTP